MGQKFRGGRRGFALAELAAVIVVVVLTVILAGLVMRRERAAMWDAVDAENLHRFAEATTAYAADNGELFWTTSWRKGMDLPTEYGDLKFRNADDIEAGAAQIIDILRRKAGRLDMTFISLWISQLYYSHLPLYDYLDAEVPGLWGVCPADRHRLSWAKDPDAFDDGEFLPCQPSPNQTNKRWPYSSSYQLAPMFWDHSPDGQRVEQAAAFDGYYVSGSLRAYAHSVNEVAFPSEKVLLFEMKEHHLGEGAGKDCDQPREFVYPDARVAVLFVDGHAAWNKTEDANRGWRPNDPDDSDPTFVSVPNGKAYPGVYRWTRGDLAGRDFGGPEVGPP